MSSIDSFSNLFPYINLKLRKCEQILSLIGLYFVCKFSSKLFYKLIKLSYYQIWAQIRANPLKGSKSWAVVTFVSNKFGVSFAEKLAENGFDLVLIDDNKQLLDSISAQISSKYQIQVKTILVDFSDGLESYRLIERQIEDKNIGLLLNNVSLINEFTNNYTNLSSKQIFMILNKEMVSVLIMTSMVLPQMISRRSGYIINVSSILSVVPMPYLSLHSASKAFVDRFSTALSYECQPKGITVQSLMPSVCSDKSMVGLLAPSHTTYAKFAFNTIGLTNRTTGYFGHEFQFWLLERVPQILFPYLSSYFLNSFKFNFT